MLRHLRHIIHRHLAALGRHASGVLSALTLSTAAFRTVCALMALVALLSMDSCRIEPPLKLAEVNEVVVGLGEVVTDIDVIWDLDEDWRKIWWYGWDDNDIRRWGKIEYPDPTNFEGRFYYFGETPGASSWLEIEKNTIYAKSMRRRFNFGYHNMLLWSNIDSPDGTQVLVVDESDMSAIVATTTRSRLSYLAPSRVTPVHNNPEIFYAGALDDIYISKFFEDYDYYDEELGAWVKQLNTTLYPLVYIYLVQVVIYNNDGRIVSMSDNPSISNLAESVYMHSGHTANAPVRVVYEMGFKKDLPARDGRPADIFGGKLTTFGLCDMEPWSKSRAPEYAGSRSELDNHLSVLMHFSNSNDSAYHYDITPQMQRQAHGGVITIEIDADTLKIPGSKGVGSMFDPTIVPMDSVEYVFPM